MSEYVKRLAQTAVRFTGQPSAISPQLEDYNRIPNVRRPMEGDATEFRLILYVGYIDISDIAITFPKQNVMGVTVKHGIKAIDALSHRLSKVTKIPQVFLETHCPLICSREDVCFFNLPSNVKKSSLTAHMSQDGFLVIQSRMLSVEEEGRTGFDMKRLVVVKVCRDLEPSLSGADCRTMALSLIEQAANLAANVVETLRPDSEDNEEDASGRGEASQREQTGEDETNREEVAPEADEVSRSEERRGVQSEASIFRPIQSGVETLRDLSREMVGDLKRIREVIDTISRKELAEDESRERSQIESSFTVVRRQQQSKTLTKHIPQVSSGPREIGDGMRSKAVDMAVRKEESPKGKDTKEKSCMSKPSTSARRDSSGSGGQSSVVDKPELEFKEPKSLDESSVAKSSKIAEERSAKLGLGKETSTGRKISTEEEFNVERKSKAKDSSVEKKAVESKKTDVKEKTSESKELSDEKARDSKDPGVEEKAPDRKEPVVEEATEGKEPDIEEKASESKERSDEKASDSQDPDVEEKATVSNEPDVEEKVEESTKLSIEKASDSKDPSVEEKAPDSKEPVVEEATEGKEPDIEEKAIVCKERSDEKASDSPDPDVKEKTTVSNEPDVEEKVRESKKLRDEKASDSKDPSVEEKAPDSKEPVVEETTEGKEPDVEEKASDSQDPDVEENATVNNDPDVEEKVRESKNLSDEKASDSKDPSVEEKAPDSKEPADGEKVSESKEPSLKKKGTASAKASTEKKSSAEKSAESEMVSFKKEPSLENDTKTEGKSDSKDPSPDKEVKEPSPHVKESSQSSRATRRRDSKTEADGDKVTQRDPQDVKEKKVATKSLPVRSTRSVVASLAAPSKPPASPLKVGRSKVKTEEAPGTPSKRSTKKHKDFDASKR